MSTVTVAEALRGLPFWSNNRPWYVSCCGTPALAVPARSSVVIKKMNFLMFWLPFITG